VARRLREGGPPSYPPGRADAMLLGGTVIDLLAREEGDRAAVAAIREGPQTVLDALGGRRRDRHTAAAWRSHLTRVAEGTEGGRRRGRGTR
jgi:hypothetical protein